MSFCRCGELSNNERCKKCGFDFICKSIDDNNNNTNFHLLFYPNY